MHIFNIQVYLQFLASFVDYLDEWQLKVKNREGYTRQEKDKMFLSLQTYQGVVTTGMYIFSIHNENTFLPHNIINLYTT